MPADCDPMTDEEYDRLIDRWEWTDPSRDELRALIRAAMRMENEASARAVHTVNRGIASPAEDAIRARWERKK